MDNVAAGLHRPQPFLFIVKDAWKPFISSRNGLCQVDSLTAPPANATQREATRSRALRGKDQTADGTWPSKHSVHPRPRCAKAPSRRTGHGQRPCLAKGARAPETKPQLRARKVVCIPLLIPQPDRERYQFFSVSYHI